jgi:2'-5' RNA ligase
LFVAVDVDRETRDAAERLAATLRRAHPGVDRALRWVDVANLHLTLRFLGERDDAEALQHVLAPSFSEPRFFLEWTAPGWLPPHGRPRVFCVDMGAGAECLHRVAGELSARLQSLGVPPEDRPFTAHLTLARVRDGADPAVIGPLRRLVSGLAFAPGRQVPVDNVVLYESRLSPKGPTYVPLLRSRLA